MGFPGLEQGVAGEGLGGLRGQLDFVGQWKDLFDPEDLGELACLVAVAAREDDPQLPVASR
jgi:hypothetical protein